MAINKKLIHFNKKETFENELAKGNILPTSIIFIKNTKEIWTHGQYYDCNSPDLSNYITKEELEEELNNKVDKVTGKQLSTEDFTTILKQKLEGLTNYDDTKLSERIEGLKGRLDTILDDDNVTIVIDTFQEIEKFLQGITNTQTLTGLLQEMKDDIVKLCADTYVTIDSAQTIKGEKSFTENVVMAAEKCFIGYEPRKKESTSGWAYNPFQVKGLDNISFAKFGVYGVGDDFKYIYIGSYGYDDQRNLRISPDGKATAVAFAKYDGTSNQFLKADGSVDNTKYLPLSGNSTISGQLTLQDGNEPLSIYRNLDGNLIPHINFHNIVNGVKTYQGEFGMKDTYPVYWDKTGNATWRKVWCEGNDGSGSGLDADLLDGNQGSWYQSNALKFKLVKSAAVDAPVDLNTDIAGGGIVGNISSYNYWRNAPAGFSLGAVIEFERTTNQNWAGQLAFDSKNSDTAPTKSLWWRSSWGDGFKNDWHQIAFTDSNVASADKLTTKQLTNEDLNTIKSDNFASYFGQTGNTCVNKPADVNGFNLTCYKTSNNYYIQIVSTVSFGDYRRTCSNGTWTPWKKLLTEDDLTDIKNRLTALENKQ